MVDEEDNLDPQSTPPQESIKQDAPKTAADADKGVLDVKKKALSITIKDVEVLYAAYMPFLKSGGLFIPTKKKFSMGDLLTLMITLPGSEAKNEVECHVVWITPVGSPGNKAAGVGVEFSNDSDGEDFRRKIEVLLAHKSKSTDATHTM